MTRTLLTSALIAALGGLVFGFDTVVISGAEQHLEMIYAPMQRLSPSWTRFWHGFMISSALIGTIVGSLFSGKPADKYGRRYVMFWLAILFFVSAVGSALAWDWYSLVLFRFIGGLGIGGASVVGPMYIAEISPAQWRGRLVALSQFNIVLGILFAYISNYFIASLSLGDVEWRWMFGVAAIPAALYYVLLFYTPRSPRWLISQQREQEARVVLSLINADNRTSAIDEEIADIRKSIDLDHHSLEEPFFQWKYRRPILLAFMIAAFNQLSGINAILYYSRRIFESAGFDKSAGLMNSIGLGIVILIFTVIGMSLIDSYGRKTLMLIGSLGYIVSLGATAWAFSTQRADDGNLTEFGSKVVLVSLFAFIASHAVGQGAVIWVFVSEIFPNRLRARGLAFGCFIHWVFAALISQAFPLIAERSAAVVFSFFALCMVGQLIWVLTKMPETKGIPLEEIQEQLGIA